MPSNLQKSLLGALAGGIAGGGLSGYLSSKNKVDGESKKDRRKRILTNALIGTGLGGVAGGGLTGGASMLGKAMDAQTPLSSLDSKTDYSPGTGLMDQINNRITPGVLNPFSAEDSSGTNTLKGVGGLIGGMSSFFDKHYENLKNNISSSRSSYADNLLTKLNIKGKSLKDKLNNLRPKDVKRIAKNENIPRAGNKMLNLLKADKLVQDSKGSFTQSSGLTNRELTRLMGPEGSKIVNRNTSAIGKLKSLLSSKNIAGQKMLGNVNPSRFITSLGLRTGLGLAAGGAAGRSLDVMGGNDSNWNRARNYAIIDRLKELAESRLGRGVENAQELFDAQSSIGDADLRNIYGMSKGEIDRFTSAEGLSGRKSLERLINLLKSGDKPTVPSFLKR